MIELECDMWKEQADAHVITTNGDVNRNGEAVMGRGCACEAANRFTAGSAGSGSILPLAKYLATCIGNGNHVHDLGTWISSGVFRLVSFPVKHHWHERADIELIKRSAEELLALISITSWNRVLMPRPGCGNGSLKWSEVKPVLEPIFDDRFVIVFKRGSR